VKHFVVVQPREDPELPTQYLISICFPRTAEFNQLEHVVYRTSNEVTTDAVG
jgi:hypothetical protein